MVESPGVRRCRIAGTRGTLTWDAASHEVRQFCGAGGEWADLYTGTDLDFSGAYVAEMEQFLECVNGRALVEVSGEDALRTLEVILAAKRSAIEGRAVQV
jgi:predicted dehydrogenase